MRKFVMIAATVVGAAVFSASPNLDRLGSKQRLVRVSGQGDCGGGETRHTWKHSRR